MRYNPLISEKNPPRDPLTLDSLYSLCACALIYKTVEYYHFYVKINFSKFCLVWKRNYYKGHDLNFRFFLFLIFNTHKAV